MEVEEEEEEPSTFSKIVLWCRSLKNCCDFNISQQKLPDRLIEQSIKKTLHLMRITCYGLIASNFMFQVV